MRENGFKRNEEFFWTGQLVKLLRGRRSLSEFGTLIGAPKNTVWRWEAGIASPHRRYAERLTKLSKKEKFLADWELVGSITITGDIEDGSKRIARTLKRSLERTAREL